VNVVNPDQIAADQVPEATGAPERPSGVDPTGDRSPSDYEKTRYSQELTAWEKRWEQIWSDLATARALDNSRDDSETAAEIASLKSIQDAYVATAQATLDRALTRTNVLTTAIGTITTLYTGLLAFIYTKAETATGGKTGVTIEPLKPVALIPVLFLASALFLATVYAAVLRKKTTVGPFLPTGIGGRVAEQRLITYMNWCFAGVLARRWALHAGITSLGIGVATLPLAFTDTTDKFHTEVLVVGIVLVVLTAAWTQFGSWLWNKIRS
jgi:hypothetical protein